MRTAWRWIFCVLLLLPVLVWGQQEETEEIVVTGKLPGPGMWKISNGEHALWIFTVFSPVPKDMIWESKRVEAVIAKADEFLEMPGTDVSVSPLVLLNPINYFRGYRLAKRLSRNPDDKPLKEVMPPELYQRFEALKARYFPNDKDIEELRPVSAGQNMVREVQQKSGLVQNNDIMNKIKRLVGRKRGIRQTSTLVKMRLEGGYGTLAERVEKMVNSLPSDQEIACMESQIHRMETELEEMQSRAISWAQGFVRDFRNVKFRGDEDDPCFGMLMASTENQTITDLMKQSQQQWLTAADKALATNTTTFAVLNISEMFRENGLLAQLKAKGYEVKEP